MKARQNTRLAVVALLIAMVALSVVLPAAAQGSRPIRHVPNDDVVNRSASPERVAEVAAQSVRMPDGRVQVIVTLAGEPTVRDYIAAGGRSNDGFARSAASARLSTLQAEQSAVATAAASIGAQVVNSHTFLTNTVTLAVHPDQISSLWRIPGVVNVSPNRIYYREDTTSVPLINAPDVWEAATSFTGDGVIIGVIDTGLDYTHSHFGGPGDYAAAGASNDATDSAGLYPAPAPSSPGDPKVIGGYDFVGDAYEPGLTRVEDNDPLDCAEAAGGGHGSHVAGTAAGYGVNADGSTYDGSLGDAIYTNFPAVTTALRIGPGVAPYASLVSMKVFGCEGATDTDVLLDAIESAVTGDFEGTVTDVLGGVDVVNMSIGSAFGSAADDDPLVDAQEAATDAGVVFVESAGNNGNITLVSGAPGTTNSVINVASALDYTAVADATVTRNNGDGSPVIYGATPGAANNALLIPFTGNLVLAEPIEACQPLTNVGEVAGNIVLIRRGNPADPDLACPQGFADKQNHAYQAGASGVIVYNQAAAGDAAVSMTDVGVVSGYDLPTYHIGNTAGEALIDAMEAADPTLISVTLGFGDPSISMAEGVDTISSFSSRGGVVRGNDDMTFKPNVAAPGNTIVSARSGTGDAFYVISGTSMASPHVAGIAALLREKYPTATVAEIKAMIMNTATNSVSGANPAGIHPPQRVGAGRVDAFAASTTDVIAYWQENPENVTVSFGYPKVLDGDTLNITETIVVQNFSGLDVLYDVSLEQRSDMPGVSFQLSDDEITVPANGTTTIEVTLTGSPHASGVNVLTYAFDAASANVSFLTEESALVQLVDQNANQPDLVVAVYAAPHAVSDIDAEIGAMTNMETYSIDFAGTEIYTGGSGFGTEISSLATVLELVAEDEDDDPVSFSPRPGDDYLQDDVASEAADIRAFGITTDYAASASDASVYFGFAMQGEWTSPRDVMLMINMDPDQDGDADYALINNFAASNTYQTAFLDINGMFGPPETAYTFTGIDPLNGYHGFSVDTMLFKNNVVVLPYWYQLWNTQLPANLQIHGEFDYWIETYTRDSDFAVVIDTLGSSADPYSYDPANAPYSFVDASGQDGGPYLGSPLYLADPLFAAPIDVNPDAVGSLPDILVLLHHNELAEGRWLVLDAPDASGITGSEFDLISPSGDFILDGESANVFTWESIGTTDIVAYRFLLTHLSNNTRLGTVVDVFGLTAADDADELICDADICTLTLDGLILSDGQYSWTAAYYGFEGEVEAANGPALFTVEQNDINLIANPGFETCTGTTAASWSGNGKCKLNAVKANSGDGFANIGKAKTLTQNISHPALSQLVAGDTLDFEGYFNAKAAAGTVAVLKIKYADSTKEKVKLTIATNTSDYELVGDTVEIDSAISSIKVKLGSKTGKVKADDLSLSTTGVNGPEVRGETGVLPPPAAPEGFRGGN